MRPITEPRHQHELARAFGIRGALVAPTLEGSIQPVVIVEDLGRRDESAEQPHIRRVGALFNQSGDATHPGQVWLPAPVPGMIFVVRSLVVQSLGATGQLVIGCTPQANLPVAASSFQGVNRNRRLIGLGAGALSGAATQAPMVISSPFYQFPAVTVPVILDGLGIVLTSSNPDGFAIRMQDNNAAMMGGVQWDEFPLQA